MEKRLCQFLRWQGGGVKSCFHLTSMNGSYLPMIKAAYLIPRSPVNHGKIKCVNTAALEHGSMLEYHRIHLSDFLSNGGEAFRAVLRDSWSLRLNIY